LLFLKSGNSWHFDSEKQIVKKKAYRIIGRSAFSKFNVFSSTDPCYQIASNLVQPFKSSLEILFGANYLVTFSEGFIL
jgi:hypothetical protein